MSLPKLRVGINLGNKALVRRGQNSLTGQAPELARSLAGRLDMSPDFRLYDSAALLAADYRDGWDIAFLAIEPSRRETLAFSRPYMSIEATIAVRVGLAAQNCREVIDDPEINILSAKGAAYHSKLEKLHGQALIVEADGPADAIERGRSGEANAVAGIRQSLEAGFSADPGWRVLPDSFARIEQAIAVARHRKELIIAINEQLSEILDTLE